MATGVYPPNISHIAAIARDPNAYDLRARAVAVLTILHRYQYAKSGSGTIVISHSLNRLVIHRKKNFICLLLCLDASTGTSQDIRIAVIAIFAAIVVAKKPGRLASAARFVVNAQFSWTNALQFIIRKDFSKMVVVLSVAISTIVDSKARPSELLRSLSKTPMGHWEEIWAF
jgi:hypothetical protein